MMQSRESTLVSTKSCNCRSSSLGIARRYTTHAHYAWVIVWVVFLASVAAPLNQFKVPPLLPVLVETFDIELGQAALLMSSFAITGVICALPAGLVLQRLGLKTTGIIALLSLIIGSGLGAVVDRAGWLMATRVLEGIGMGLISLVGPSAITLWFRREKQGLPMFTTVQN